MDDKDKDQGDKGQAVSGTAKSTLVARSLAP